MKKMGKKRLSTYVPTSTNNNPTGTKSTVEPIPLPHDGPIYHGMIEEDDTIAKLDTLQILEASEEKNRVRTDDPILVGCLQVIRRCGNRDGPIIPFENENDERVRTLLQTLIQATHVHSQLRALQQFRNKTISLPPIPPSSSHEPQTTNTDVACPNHNHGNEDHDAMNQKETTAAVLVDISSPSSSVSLSEQYLYRILLEWMISCHTPVSVRRAINSCLSVLLMPTSSSSPQDGKALKRCDSIWDHILESIIVLPQHEQQVNSWYNPLHTLNEFVSWEPIEEWLPRNNTKKLEHILFFVLQQTFKMSNASLSPSDFVWEVEQITLVANLINKCLVIMITTINQPGNEDNDQSVCTALNVSSDDGNDNIIDTIQQLQNYLWNIITRDQKTIPLDRLSNIGIAFGRTVQFQMIPSTSTATTTTTCLLSSMMDRIASLPLALQRITLLHGMAVIVPLHDDLTWLDGLVMTCKNVLLQECDPDVRCFALKGLRTLMSRIHTMLSNVPKLQPSDTSTDRTRPPSLSNSTIIPSFDVNCIRRVVVEVLQIVLQSWENPSTKKLANAIPALFESVIQVMMKISIDHSLDELVDRILAQPPHLKGRYLALEILMPITGATRFVVPHMSTSTLLLDDLLKGIGDCGHNTGVMADLWAKILRQLRIEFHERKNESETDATVESSWLKYWVPSLSNALILSDLTRRKQIASFCLPRIVSMEIRDSAPRIAAAPIFEAILTSIEAISTKSSTQYYTSAYTSQETHNDRIVWAILEVIRHAAAVGLLKPTLDGTIHLRGKVATLVPEPRLRSMLTHSSMTIRIAAFQAMDAIVSTYGGKAFESTCWEAALWKYSLPFSIKTDGKEFTLSLLQCLLLFLDRLLISEAASIHESIDRAMPVFHDFVVDFLLFDIAIKKAGYPGTVALKESFLLLLLECVIVFCSREHPLATDSKLLPKSTAVFRRRRLIDEERAILEAKKALMSREMFECCVSLLQSNWDNTRSTSYRILISLVQLGVMDSIHVPSIYASVDAHQGYLRRGIFLASSPRQREADTGARLLSFLFVALRSESEKESLLKKLVDLLGRRLLCMKQMLKVILSCTSKEKSQYEQIPLAHGIIHTVRLIIESDDSFVHGAGLRDHIEGIISHLLDAIRISLAVVADVKEGETVDGMDEDLISELPFDRQKSTRMVNPSAIGANGIFSSVSRISEAEHVMRLASQRIIVGSWLLTKETCGALAAVLFRYRFNVSSSYYDESGRLLISTLTSLKHTGAAFAAHRALQTIAQSCFQAERDRRLFLYPETWVTRILDEILCAENIRDSTLRRSTGYSLGVLSIMRAEILTQPQHLLCRSILTKIVGLCLPSKSQYDLLTATINLNEDLKRSLCAIAASDDVVLNTDHGNVRMRVHALNILRSILLDAPLAKEVHPYAGIAIIASLLGYADAEWSVRNSSTMVFAAAMLRSVDADKNATNKDSTGRNPITIYELFRSYPSLGPFLLAWLKGGVEGLFDNHQDLSLPPILPILLLLSRVNPVSKSGYDSIVHAEAFIPDLLLLLRHKILIIRKNASVALRNLVSLDVSSKTSLEVPLMHCAENLISILDKGGNGSQWNHVHGILLTILELVRSFPEAKSWLSSNGTSNLIITLSRLYGGSPIVPPLCLSVSIEIMGILCQRNIFFYNTCQGILLWSSNSDEENTDENIGSSELAAKLATTMVNMNCSIVWDNSITFETKDRCLDQLSSLFHSDCIDARIAAAKTFKKSLSKNLAELMISDVSHRIMERLLLVLLSAMECELSRNSHYIHPHFPTLRRLSRCLLAILCPSSIASKKKFSEEVYLKSASVAKNLLNSIANGCAPDLLTLLHGNALEMMHIKYDGTVPCSNQRLLLLTDGLTHPFCHWRLRLSAANALRKLVRESEAVMVPFSNFYFLKSWIVLIQDEDSEVRSAAISSSSDILHPSNDVAELAIVQNMHRLVMSNPTQEMMQSLLHVLFQLCENLFHDTCIPFDQNSEWNDVDPFQGICNNGTSRLIFESDTPNSYSENCLVCQLVAVLSVQMHRSLPIIPINASLLAAANDFLKQTKHILSGLLDCIVADSLDVMYNNFSFPLFHNHITGTLVLACMLGHESLFFEEIHSITTMILETAKELHLTEKIHPIIENALKITGNALKTLVSDKMQATTNIFILSLYECCFLFPQSIWSGYSHLVN